MTEVNFGRSRLACHPHPCFCFPNSPAFGQIWSNLAPNLRRLARVGPHLAGFARASLLGRVASNRSAASGHACATGFVGFLVGPKRVGMLPMFSFASARLPGPCWASPQVRREARGGGVRWQRCSSQYQLCEGDSGRTAERLSCSSALSHVPETDPAEALQPELVGLPWAGRRRRCSGGRASRAPESLVDPRDYV